MQVASDHRSFQHWCQATRDYPYSLFPNTPCSGENDPMGSSMRKTTKKGLKTVSQDWIVCNSFRVKHLCTNWGMGNIVGCEKSVGGLFFELA